MPQRQKLHFNPLAFKNICTHRSLAYSTRNATSRCFIQGNAREMELDSDVRAQMQRVEVGCEACCVIVRIRDSAVCGNPLLARLFIKVSKSWSPNSPNLQEAVTATTSGLEPILKHTTDEIEQLTPEVRFNSIRKPFNPTSRSHVPPPASNFRNSTDAVQAAPGPRPSHPSPYNCLPTDEEVSFRPYPSSVSYPLHPQLTHSEKS